MDNSKQLIDKAKEWIKDNRSLLRKYKGQWIAYNGDLGIIAHDKDATYVMKVANESGAWHVLKYLNPYTYGGLRRLVPIRFRPLHKESWEPNLIVSIKNRDKEERVEMLVDSGADISTVTYKVGLNLGFERFDSEVVDLAAGVKGTVEYVLRSILMTIEGHTFKAPIAWILNEACDDILLGREVVFDQFDIEFKQKDETILFKKRVDA